MLFALILVSCHKMIIESVSEGISMFFMLLTIGLPQIIYHSVIIYVVYFFGIKNMLIRKPSIKRKFIFLFGGLAYLALVLLYNWVNLKDLFYDFKGFIKEPDYDLAFAFISVIQINSWFYQSGKNIQ
jgi:hypothetical protein